MLAQLFQHWGSKVRRIWESPEAPTNTCSHTHTHLHTHPPLTKMIPQSQALQKTCYNHLVLVLHYRLVDNVVFWRKNSWSILFHISSRNMIIFISLQLIRVSYKELSLQSCDAFSIFYLALLMCAALIYWPGFITEITGGIRRGAQSPVCRELGKSVGL